MSKRPTATDQLDALGFFPLPIVSFDAGQLDYFVQTHGVDWCLYTATPSVIGKISKGDYRRPNQVDTISSNGFLYRNAGIFTAVILSNSKAQNFGDMGGLLSQASARLVMPRFFNDPATNAFATSTRIMPCVGDRIYKNGAEADCSQWVVSYQECDYNFGENSKAAYPIKQVVSIDTANGTPLIEGQDFTITPDGEIAWVPGGNNPGINPNTQTGLPFGIRYLYVPYFYVSALPHELRISSVIQGNGVNGTARLPYHVEIQREYLYTNQQNNNKTANTPTSPTPTRDPVRPSEPMSGHAPIKVSISDISNE